MSSNNANNGNEQAPKLASTADCEGLEVIARTLVTDTTEIRSLAYGFDGSSGNTIEMGWKQDGSEDSDVPKKMFAHIADEDDNQLFRIDFEPDSPYVESDDIWPSGMPAEATGDALHDLLKSHDEDTAEYGVLSYVKKIYDLHIAPNNDEKSLALVSDDLLAERYRAMMSILDITAPEPDAEGPLPVDVDRSRRIKAGAWVGYVSIQSCEAQPCEMPAVHFEIEHGKTGDVYQYDTQADGKRSLVKSRIVTFALPGVVAETEEVVEYDGPPLLTDVGFLIETLFSAEPLPDEE